MRSERLVTKNLDRIGGQGNVGDAAFYSILVTYFDLQRFVFVSASPPISRPHDTNNSDSDGQTTSFGLVIHRHMLRHLHGGGGGGVCGRNVRNIAWHGWHI